MKIDTALVVTGVCNISKVVTSLKKMFMSEICVTARSLLINVSTLFYKDFFSVHKIDLKINICLNNLLKREDKQSVKVILRTSQSLANRIYKCYWKKIWVRGRRFVVIFFCLFVFLVFVWFGGFFKKCNYKEAKKVILEIAFCA